MWLEHSGNVVGSLQLVYRFIDCLAHTNDMKANSKGSVQTCRILPNIKLTSFDNNTLYCFWMGDVITSHVERGEMDRYSSGY
jgi:hypothetical protein